MEYLLKASALLAIFYGCYILFLQRETFFMSNRWFLLTGILISVLLPLVVIPMYLEMPETNTKGFILTATGVEKTPETFSVMSLFIPVYAIVTSFFLGRLIIQLFSLIALIRKHNAKKVAGYTFIETPQNTAPFSFFNWIVYNPGQFNAQELELILQHEKVHARQMHSVDVLITDIAVALFWFNPFIWLYKKALKQNLEFIADHYTQKQSTCEERYQKLLLKTSLPQKHLMLINTFYNSTIRLKIFGKQLTLFTSTGQVKKRILMLHKSKSNLMNTWKYSIIIPFLVIFTMIFNTKTIAQTTSKSTSQSTERNVQNILKFVVTKDTKDKQLDFIKDKLTDKGATIIFNNVKRNSKHELTSIKIDVDYKGTSANHFINSSEPIPPTEISMNPSDGTINVGQQSSVLSQTLDVATTENGTIELRKTPSSKIIVTSKDNSNKQVTTMEDAEVIVIEKDGDTNVKLSTNDAPSPLALLDGTEISKQQMEALDPNSIESVFVLKDESATEKYGDKGENGVILITTKKNKVSSIDKNPPLYFLEDKEITKEQMEGIDPNTIAAVNVLKDEQATKKYGKKGKNGVIIITLKKE